MPKKELITFDDAVRLLNAKQSECFNAGSFGDSPGQYGWYDLHFVNWISSLGHHIELTGDEFESHFPSENVA